MRSLWKMIALRWLGGRGSEALTEDSPVLDLSMTGEPERPQSPFHVTRLSEVSPDAIMRRRDLGSKDPETAIAEMQRNDDPEG